MRALLLLLLLTPGAAAVDLLATHARFDDHEARLIVRSAQGNVSVRTEPAVEVAGVFPGAVAEAFARAPVELPARGHWHGLDGVVEIVLRRDDPRRSIEVVVQAGSEAGVSVGWPPAGRDVAGPGVALFLGVLALAATRGKRGNFP